MLAQAPSSRSSDHLFNFSLIGFRHQRIHPLLHQIFRNSLPINYFHSPQKECEYAKTDLHVEVLDYTCFLNTVSPMPAPKARLLTIAYALAILEEKERKRKRQQKKKRRGKNVKTRKKTKRARGRKRSRGRQRR